jgi:cysteine desulfurase
MTNSIYLDNAASTPVDVAVVERMADVMAKVWGNPSALHPQGVAARRVIEGGRQQVLAALGDSDQIGDLVWTSGCTEADALALLGAAAVGPGDIVVSTVEHAAVTQNAMRLQASGRRVHWVAPTGTGQIDPEQFAARSRNARVVAVVAVQNEVGVIQPIEQIVAAVKAVAPGCHVHLDAAQAFGKIELDIHRMAVDSIAIAAHKFHGPPGVGALWLRRGVPLVSLWAGSGQQRGLRSGGQNVPGTAGIGLAAALARQHRDAADQHWRALADRVRHILEERDATATFWVDESIRVPHILALGFRRVTAEALRNTMASRGVAVSSGSACASSAPPGGHGSMMLAAMGVSQDMALVRLSFGRQTSLSDVETAAVILADVVRELAG